LFFLFLCFCFFEALALNPDINLSEWIISEKPDASRGKKKNERRSGRGAYYDLQLEIQEGLPFFEDH